MPDEIQSYEDITPEAYEIYLGQHAQYERQWPGLAGAPKTYEEWAEGMQYRHHERWVEYVRARRDWKASTLYVFYGPEGEAMFPFPSFPEWLEANP